MFGPEFFPTPPQVIETMLEGYDPFGKVCLEPSAGKGNIVDFLITAGAKDVIACENNEDLQKLVATKCRVIASDFFTVTSDMISHINCIIMNPPFSNADKHILHAWEVAPSGCTIISLCNEETVNNSYSRSRNILGNIIEEYGNETKLGKCFSDGERMTEVYVSCVKLLKPGGDYEAEFSGFFLEDDEPELHANAIMPYNSIRDLVNRYIGAVKLFDQQLEMGSQMNDLIGTFYRGQNLAFTCTRNGIPKLRNDLKKELQKDAWNHVFQQLNMQKYATQGLRNDINKFVEHQCHIPFTMRNIYRMIDIVIGTTGSRMDTALLEVFENVTRHTHENRYGVEGWKTNSHYLLNQKFIMDYITEVGYRGEMKLHFGGSREIIEDMQKALCYLTGMNYDNCSSLYQFTDHLHCEWGKWYSWGFFEIRGYKKGTMHFKFQDPDLWEKFNQNIARIKGYPLFESKAKKKEPDPGPTDIVCTSQVVEIEPIIVNQETLQTSLF